MCSNILTTIKCRLRWILKESLVPRASTLGISDIGICRRKIMDSSQNRARQGDDPGIVEIPRNKNQNNFRRKSPCHNHHHHQHDLDLHDHHDHYHASTKNGPSRGEEEKGQAHLSFLLVQLTDRLIIISLHSSSSSSSFISDVLIILYF